jgi:multicomponent Na+:H+ antiporter subunit G
VSLVLEIVSNGLLLAGAAFCVIGGIGVLRLPDLYTRTHAVSVSDSLGAVLVLLGLAVQADSGLGAAKLVTIVLFLLLTGPATAHALVKAAYSRGLAVETETSAQEERRDDPD